MVFALYIIWTAAAVYNVLGLPLNEDAKFPQAPKSNPYEINGLNYVHEKVNAENSLDYIDKTVRQVEAILKANASLPRLTRGEILEIIENITKSDLAIAQKGKLNERAQKAVMLVMPYTPNHDDDKKMQELYTKAPVTQIVNDSLKFESTTPTNRRKPPAKQKGSTTSIPNVQSSPGEITSSSFKLTFNTATKPPTHVPLNANIQKGSHRQVTAATVKHILHELTTERMKYRRQSTTQIPISTTKTFKRRRPVQESRYPNHKYPEESQSNVHKPASFPSTNLNQFTTQKPVKFTYQTVSDAKPSSPHYFTTSKPALLDVNLPDELKSALEELNIDDSFRKNPAKYDFFNLPNTNDQIQENHKVIHTFSSPDPLVVPDISNVANTLTPEMKELLINFGLLGNENRHFPSAKEVPYVEISTAEVRPDSYVKFKPLPDISGANKEMEEFLGRFGLGKTAKSGRIERKIHRPQDTLSEIPGIDFEVVPDSFKGVAMNLGLWKREGKDYVSQEASVQAPDNKHVFNPMETPYASEEELEKLNQLMELIKQLEKLNGTASDEDLDKLDMKQIKELVESLQKNESAVLGESEYALNPLNDDDISLIKNEVKRQGNSTGNSTERTTALTNAQESETVNIKDLEDSFGGGGSVSEVEVTIPPPTEPPKTGFYYLLDWNTFFDIDDQKGKRVNLRFQPKAGDPRQFISVTVP